MDNNSYLEPCKEECAFCFLNYTDVMERNDLFTGLEKRELGTIIKETHHQVKHLEKGELLAKEGDTLSSYIIIVEGSIVGEMMDYEGNMLTIEKRSAPQSIATAFLFGKKNILPVSVTAIEDTRLLLISRDDLLSLFTRSPQIMKNFLDMISNRAQFLSERIKLLSISDLRGKLAFYLMGQMKKSGQQSFKMPHSQQELAEMFGSTRPSVGRTLRELHHNKYIEAKGRNIIILDMHAMSELIG